MMEGISSGRFYVYIHKRLDNGEIFYVGKGTRDRITKKDCRNKYWKEIVDKYGFTYEKVIDSIDDESADELEMFLISLIGKNNLTNMTDGGKGHKGYSPSKKTIEKLRKASSGRRHSEETKKKISEANMGRKVSKESIEKMLKTKGDFKHSEETKKLYSLQRKGVLKSEAHKKALSDNSGRAKEIICIELGKIFKSSSEAARYLGNINKRKCINDAVLGRQKTAYGYTWKYTK